MVLWLAYLADYICIIRRKVYYEVCFENRFYNDCLRNVITAVHKCFLGRLCRAITHSKIYFSITSQVGRFFEKPNLAIIFTNNYAVLRGLGRNWDDYWICQGKYAIAKY